MSSHVGRVLAMPRRRESVLEAGAWLKAGSRTGKGIIESDGRSSHCSLPPAALWKAGKAIHKAVIKLSRFGDWHLKQTSTDFKSL